MIKSSKLPEIGKTGKMYKPFKRVGVPIVKDENESDTLHFPIPEEVMKAACKEAQKEQNKLLDDYKQLDKYDKD